MAKWIVSSEYTSITKKLCAPNLRLTIFNNLFLDDDCTLYYIPKNYIKDDFTNPFSDNAKWKSDAADLHDIACDFHALIKVNLTIEELEAKKYLKEVDGYLYCCDIPTEYLEVVFVTKWEADCMFKRAMKASGCINGLTIGLYRTGVFFNVGWLGRRELIKLKSIGKLSFNTSKKLAKCKNNFCVNQ